jgi:hypothetical protein
MLNGKVGIVRQVPDAMEVRNLAMKKIPHEKRPGEPNPAELFRAPHGARAPHCRFAARVAIGATSAAGKA